MKCSNCGAENVNGAVFCFNCGSTVSNDSQPQASVDQTQDIPLTQPQYGYEQPQTGYEQPQTGYEQPQTGYEQPQYGYEQPQTGYEQPQYGYEQPQYGYEQPQYGYEQPQYGYEQPQYGYEQPQPGYEQPQYGQEKPLYSYEQPQQASVKKSKSGKIIAALVVVLVVLVIGVFGYLAIDAGWVEIRFNPGKEDTVPLVKEQITENQIKKYTLSNPAHDADSVKIKYSSHKATEIVEPSNAAEDCKSILPDDKNSMYIYISVLVENVSDKYISFENIYTNCTLDSRTKTVEIYGETNKGKELTKNVTLNPGEKKTVHFVSVISNSEFETYKNYHLTFGFDSTYSSAPVTEGEKACDYLFEFTGVKH